MYFVEWRSSGEYGEGRREGRKREDQQRGGTPY
jgi:hypothetical protein